MLRDDVRATGIVEAFVGNAKIVEDAAVDDGFLDDPRSIGCRHMAVEDSLRVDCDDGPMLALFKTARLVRADERIEPSALDLGSEGGSKLIAAVGIAAAPGIAGGALVSANEKMMGKCGHRESRFPNLKKPRECIPWAWGANRNYVLRIRRRA